MERLLFAVGLAAVWSDATCNELPAPTGLRTEMLLESAAPVLVISSVTPKFSFLPHAVWDHPGRGVNLTAYRIVVRTSAGTTAWDSGQVVVQNSLPATIQCTTQLAHMTAYSWTAQWWAGDVASAVSTPAVFEVGPAPTDWNSAPWVGDGQNEFKIEYTLASSASRVRLYLAAPGGAVVYNAATGAAIGDESGISAWVPFDQMVLYDGYPLPTQAGTHSIVVLAGHGFYTMGTFACKKPIGSGGFCGENPAVKALLAIDDAETSIARNVALPSKTARGVDVDGPAILSGRVGAVVSDDPWLGTTINWSRWLGQDDWAPTRAVPDVPPGNISALQVERVQTTGSSTSKLPSVPIAVQQLGPSTWHFNFSRNIVGHVVLKAGSYSGPGNISINHCEVMNGTACSSLAHLPGGLGTDIHILGPNTSSRDLSPRFTWHGFQHVIVTTSGGAKFDGKLNSLSAVWTVANVDESATIEFEGPGATLLSAIRDITKSSQWANMAGYIPTDCPTREKHGWLGDAQVVAEEAMYNVFSPALFQLFVRIIRDQQLKSGPYAGSVPIVVPGPVQQPGDISWTAAYPLITNWLYEYYGDVTTIRDQWSQLKLYADGQLREAGNNGTLPTFWQCGDWCAVEPRATCTPGTGPPAAGANFLLALDAMVKMAVAIGENTDASRYSNILASLRSEFDARFWNATSGTYSNDPLESQTLSALALGSGAVPQSRLATVIATLAGDVSARGNHLTVGSAGQKWLLRELTASGSHDTALRVATQTTYPSWGYWISQGATSCWESWSGVEDGSHPGQCFLTNFKPGCSPNPPTHNHIFLCGGVGEWMYRSLGGISPAGPGYSRVSISPEVSRTEGPSGVNATVSTIRGVVSSHWTRDLFGTVILRWEVMVPIGMVGELSIPLLREAAEKVRIDEEGATGKRSTIWNGKPAQQDIERDHEWLLSGPTIVQGFDETSRIRVHVGAGRYSFTVQHA